MLITAPSSRVEAERQKNSTVKEPEPFAYMAFASPAMSRQPPRLALTPFVEKWTDMGARATICVQEASDQTQLPGKLFVQHGASPQPAASVPRRNAEASCVPGFAAFGIVETVEPTAPPFSKVYRAMVPAIAAGTRAEQSAGTTV